MALLKRVQKRAERPPTVTIVMTMPSTASTLDCLRLMPSAPSTLHLYTSSAFCASVRLRTPLRAVVVGVLNKQLQTRRFLGTVSEKLPFHAAASHAPIGSLVPPHFSKAVVQHFLVAALPFTPGLHSSAACGNVFCGAHWAPVSHPIRGVVCYSTSTFICLALYEQFCRLPSANSSLNI